MFNVEQLVLVFNAEARFFTPEYRSTGRSPADRTAPVSSTSSKTAAGGLAGCPVLGGGLGLLGCKAPVRRDSQ